VHPTVIYNYIIYFCCVFDVYETYAFVLDINYMCYQLFKRACPQIWSWPASLTAKSRCTCESDSEIDWEDGGWNRDHRCCAMPKHLLGLQWFW
jgi:hypothetical protein